MAGHRGGGHRRHRRPPGRRGRPAVDPGGLQRPGRRPPAAATTGTRSRGHHRAALRQVTAVHPRPGPVPRPARHPRAARRARPGPHRTGVRADRLPHPPARVHPTHPRTPDHLRRLPHVPSRARAGLPGPTAAPSSTSPPGPRPVGPTSSSPPSASSPAPDPHPNRSVLDRAAGIVRDGGAALGNDRDRSVDQGDAARESLSTLRTFWLVAAVPIHQVPLWKTTHTGVICGNRRPGACSTTRPAGVRGRRASGRMERPSAQYCAGRRPAGPLKRTCRRLVRLSQPNSRSPSAR